MMDSKTVPHKLILYIQCRLKEKKEIGKMEYVKKRCSTPPLKIKLSSEERGANSRAFHITSQAR